VAFFTANRDTPVERRLYEVSWKRPAPPKAITPAGGWWTVKVAGRGTAFTGTYEDPATPPRTGLYRADGSRVRWVEENPLNSSHPMAPYRDRLPAPEFGTLKAQDGSDLWWSLRKPPGFDPSRRYPVVVKVYGGPGSAQVRKVWNDPADLLYLQSGFLLFSLDNRGTPNRSEGFKTAIDRRLGQLEVGDQIAGARWLAGQSFVDPARIGVTGWSYGGYMTLMLLTAPDTPFTAGVSGAPPPTSTCCPDAAARAVASASASPPSVPPRRCCNTCVTSCATSSAEGFGSAKTIASPSATASALPSGSPSPSASGSGSAAASATATSAATGSASATPTASRTSTATKSALRTPSASGTSTASRTSSPSASPTYSRTVRVARRAAPRRAAPCQAAVARRAVEARRSSPRRAVAQTALGASPRVGQSARAPAAARCAAASTRN
jgi:hypothetical protein